MILHLFNKRIILWFIAIWLMGCFVFAPASLIFAEKNKEEIEQDIQSLKNKVESQKSKIGSIEKRIKSYQKSINEHKEKQKSLANEIALIDLTIKEKESEIEKMEVQIDIMNLEIENVTLEIFEQEFSISEKKEGVASLLKRLDKLARRDTLEILASNTTFSQFYNDIKAVSDAQDGLKQELARLKATKRRLIEKKDELEVMNNSLVEFVEKLDFERESLKQEEAYKFALLEDTHKSEEKYQILLEAARKEQEEINNEIYALDKLVREKVKALGNLKSNQEFIWPVDPSRGITTYFHDPEYPFKHIFQHPGLDIRASQGTVIVAPKDGYVARVRSPKDVGKGYAYIMLVHDEGVSTVFGHVSCVKVNEDVFVAQGDAIGCVGGTPGTLGAGQLTTGAHLHYEIRKNGIPDNPLKYMP